MQEVLGLGGEVAGGLAAQLAQGCDEVPPHCVCSVVGVNYTRQFVNDRVHWNVS